MSGTRIQPTTIAGGRKLSDEARAKLSATQKARYAALTPDEQAARLARIGRKPKGAAPPPATGGPPPAAPASSGGPTNPLHDAPGDRSEPRPPRQGQVGSAPPRFIVPDLPPMETGGEPTGAPEVDQLGAGGVPFGVSEAEIADLLELPFNLLSIRRGKHWKLLPDERDMLAGPLTRKINENALTARALQVGGDWLVILGGFAFVLYSRLEVDRERAAASTTDGSRPSERAEPPGDGDRGHAARRDDLRVVGGGRLNGFSVGTDGPASHAAADQADQSSPPRQNLTF